jgi:hypothetical protein
MKWWSPFSNIRRLEFNCQVLSAAATETFPLLLSIYSMISAVSESIRISQLYPDHP